MSDCSRSAFISFALWSGASLAETVSSGRSSPPATSQVASARFCGVGENSELAREFETFKAEAKSYSEFCTAHQPRRKRGALLSAEDYELFRQFYLTFNPHTQVAQRSLGEGLRREDPQRYNQRSAGDRALQYLIEVRNIHRDRSLRNPEQFCNSKQIVESRNKVIEIVRAQNKEQVLCDYLNDRVSRRASRMADTSWATGSRSLVETAGSESGSPRAQSANLTTDDFNFQRRHGPLGINPLFGIPKLISALFKSLSGFITDIFGGQTTRTVSDPRSPEGDPNLRDRVGRNQTVASYQAPRPGATASSRDEDTRPVAASLPTGDQARIETLVSQALNENPPAPAGPALTGTGDGGETVGGGGGGAVNPSAGAAPTGSQADEGAADSVGTANPQDGGSPPAAEPRAEPFGIEELFSAELFAPQTEGSPSEQLQMASVSDSKGTNSPPPSSEVIRQQWACLKQPNQTSQLRSALDRLVATERELSALLRTCQFYYPGTVAHAAFSNSFNQELLSTGVLEPAWAQEILPPANFFNFRPLEVRRPQTSTLPVFCQNLTNPTNHSRHAREGARRLLHKVSKEACPTPMRQERTAPAPLPQLRDI